MRIHLNIASFPARLIAPVALLICLIAPLAAIAAPADWPGVWLEAETGKGDAHSKSIQYASGASAIDWETQGGVLSLDCSVTASLPGAIFHLRYAREAKDAGALDIYIGPASAKAIGDEGVRLIGHLELPSTGRLSDWHWLRLSAGDIEPGAYRLFLSCPPGHAAGYLDLLGLAPGTSRGLWQPPNNVVIGTFKDAPRTLPAFDLLGVQGKEFGDLLPEPTYLGASARQVEFTLSVRNNLFSEPLKLTLHAQLTADDGKTIDLPPQLANVPPNSTGDQTYSFALPGPGHFDMVLTAEAEGVTIQAKRSLRTVATAPLWITPHAKDNTPERLSGPGAVSVIDIDLPTDMPGALIYASCQRQARDEPGEIMEIYLGPADARDPKAADVRLLGKVMLDTLPRWGPQETWVAVNVGALSAGHHRIFLALPDREMPPAQPGERVRFPTNVIEQIGVVSDVDQGRWLPPINSLASDGTVTVQNAQLLKEAVHVDSVSCSETGHLFLGSKVLAPDAPPLPFVVSMASRIVTAPVQCIVRGRLLDASGVATDIAPMTLNLKPGERKELPYPIRAPGYGWFSVEVTTDAQNTTDTGHSALGILLDPHEGVRPDSMFGLAVGDHPEDMKVSELIGVKWRRGIPFTNPADVFIKTDKTGKIGNPLVMEPGDTVRIWGPDEMKKARDIIDAWKQNGVMCLGYVNYNLPWNCLGGAAGGWHKNRPADMKEHVEMVYNLIKPLHDEVKYWEIWNEPWVGGWTWRTGTSQDYRDMCRMIWDRVKPEMPDVMLIGGGSTPYDRDVLFALNSDNSGYVDGLSTHPYGKPDTSQPSFAALEAAMLKKFSHNGGGGGIWATELGTASFMFDPLPRTEEDLMVARTVAPLYLLSRLGAGDTPMRLFFFTSQYGSGNFSGGDLNLWDATGGSPAPRAALVAFSAMTHFIEDSRLLGDIYSTSKGAWALHFVKPDGSSIVTFFMEQPHTGDSDPMHSADSERAKGEMVIPANDFEVYDYLGRPVGRREGDQLHIPIQVWEARYFLSKLPVDQVRQALLDAQFKNVPALLVNARSFDEPLSMKPRLRFKVENLLMKSVDAKLEVTPPAEIQLASSTLELKDLKPGEIRMVQFDIASATPNDINRYMVKYRATVGDDVQEDQQPVQVACASFGTPKFGDDLSGWKNAMPVTMISRGGKDWRQITMDPSQAAALLARKEPSDTAVYRVWTEWDAHNFYLAALVPTDNPDQAIPYNGPISSVKNMPFMHDCLQVAFDCLDHNPDDLLYGNPLYEKSMAADVDYEFCAARIANGHSELHRLKAPGTNYQSYFPTNGPTSPPLAAMHAGPEAGPEGQVIVRYDDKSHAYIYQLAIPWTCIKELGEQLNALKSGQSLITHFAFAVNDTTGRGRTYWTQEAGDLQAGSYGFSPTWGGGARKMGGRILTDWGFVR